ncbi:MAG TPA: tetratricopeptide repeat protein [Candidatus Limnocylindria bacterium]|nr:tetratricopeptide repeat protein [Candidatus Limnocylindria bacterium]
MNNKRRQVEDRPGLPATGFRGRTQTIVIYLFLAAISLVVFGQTIRYDFVNFDDDLYVYNAPAIQAGLTAQGIALAFTSQHARNWHPLATLSHMLDCQLYGLKPGGHHATNVILHIITVLLLFRVLREMTGAVWKSAIVAALFAVHPLHVESVAWVSERKDVLSAMFFLLMLGGYVRYARGPSMTRYLLVAVLFAAGLMSKPMLVSVPAILLLLDYWPLRRFEQPSSTTGKTKIVNSGNQPCTRQRLFLEKIPLFVLAGGSCVATFVLQKRATGAIPPLPFLWRVENAFVSYMIYVWKTLWPTHLAVFYPHPNNTLPIWVVILAMMLLLAITVSAIVFRNKRPYVFTGWSWYLVMLMPVIGLIQVGEQGHADRYTYLPHIGLFLLAVWFAADVAAIRESRSRFATATAAVIILALASAAFIQASYWRNSETLWTHALDVTSDNDVAHNNLGYLRVDQGELDKAIAHFEAALEIRSRKLDPHYDVGSAFVQMNLADALARKGQPDEALVHYEQAIRLQPNYANAYYNRGNVLFTKGRIDEAMADWEKTLQIQPNDADAHTCIGNAFLRQSSPKEAIAHYEKAMALAPGDPHSRNNIAWVLATSSDASIRDGVKAVELAQEAVQLSRGRDSKFIRTLAAAYAESSRFPEAIAAAQQAITIAAMQGNTGLANTLRKEIALYRGHISLREMEPRN